MDRIEALNRIKILRNDKRSIRIIHYSCESFYQKGDNFSPRITSICVKNFSETQTKCFSIVDFAETLGISASQINGNYNALEKAMLDDFFDYLGVNQTSNWVHWNMRGSVYGFHAIYHRYRMLQGSPITLGENRLFDLAEMLKSIYGKDYAPHPRLEKLCQINDLSMKDFLVGAAEADAFDRENFNVLRMSTARKVDLMSDILRLVFDRKLRTNNNIVMQKLNEISIHPILVISGILITVITGGYTIFKWLVP
ncbi:hypothetical protein [Deinococcus sp. AJ005]|uniref:hypothetical protein n=1 Tax=Deinococcus sp. AJ005 TaxID=2652443 RepID=UPI00125CA915|nr:hypothetical protein [Deinococcus sp. AJ005]QFP76893.1 hypothetical protein DAAJ005_10840 [Deinococcus sp. AJ005]